MARRPGSTGSRVGRQSNCPVRLAALVPICLALGFAVNCARVAWLTGLLSRHEKMRLDFWHKQSGSLIYQAGATAPLLPIAFPLLSRGRRATPTPAILSSAWVRS